MLMRLASGFGWMDAMDISSSGRRDVWIIKNICGEDALLVAILRKKESTRKATPIVIKCRCGRWEDRCVVQSGLEETARWPSKVLLTMWVSCPGSRLTGSFFNPEVDLVGCSPQVPGTSVLGGCVGETVANKGGPATAQSIGYAEEKRQNTAKVLTIVFPQNSRQTQERISNNCATGCLCPLVVD